VELDLLLRSARREAGLSQRELARDALVPKSTVSRIESGVTSDPRLQTMQRLFEATGHRLAIVDVHGAELSGDHPDDRHRDRAGRRFPAHLPAYKITWFDHWWGWFRIAWWPDAPNVPDYGYYYPSRYDYWYGSGSGSADQSSPDDAGGQPSARTAPTAPTAPTVAKIARILLLAASTAGLVGAVVVLLLLR
jgi:transcriptional regulator with XRE-family HTH domain